MVAAAGVIGGVVARQNRIVASFRQAGATSPERAAVPSAIGVDEGMAFGTLRRHTILVAVGERFWLDEPRWEAHRVARRRLALLVPAVVLLTAGVVLWFALR